MRFIEPKQTYEKMKKVNTHIPSLNRQLLRHFGLNETGEHDSVHCQQVRRQLQSGIHDNQMLSMIGPFGSGKTFLFRQLKRQLAEQVDFVHVRAFEDQWIRIGAILTAMITDLAPRENIRRDIETRSRQVINILGERVVKQGRTVCLVIEDCHRLHVNTLNSLKLMREEDFAGYSPLFSIILLGWPEFLAKISNRKDILWRMQLVELNADMGWFTLPERIKYLENVFGTVIERGTRKRIASLHATPEALNHYVVKMMQAAADAGYACLDEKIVQPSLKEMYDSLKRQRPDVVSYQSIAGVAGVGKSTVALAIESEPNTPSTLKVRSAMESMIPGIPQASESPNAEPINRKTA